jgi:Zn-dependent protease
MPLVTHTARDQSVRMSARRTDSLWLFRVWGIDVYLHWAWLFVAFIQISYRANAYSSIGWKVVEYLALFFIVLLHEFGHALATRQVGGTADQILLWPLGGVAYVSPPPRPGAELWSIAAGPLVNVVFFFVFSLALVIKGIPLNAGGLSDFDALLRNVWFINTALLFFNLLPVYPLDGGQILRALLWFVIGRARSMYVASVVGFLGAAALGLWALKQQSIWLGIITFYLISNCRRGWAHAKALTALEQIPRRREYTCPACHTHPPIGPVWRCHECGTEFDTFETRGRCPNCQITFPTTICIDCRKSFPLAEWTPTMPE